MNIFFRLISIVCMLLLSAVSRGQLSNVGEKGLLNPPPTDSQKLEELIGKEPLVSVPTVIDPFHSFEFLLSIAVLIFGIIVISLEVYLASRNIIKPDQIYRTLVLTLVILTGLLLVTAGYSNNQITGVLGILGSISGYVVGRMDSGKTTDSEKNKKTDNES